MSMKKEATILAASLALAGARLSQGLQSEPISSQRRIEHKTILTKKQKKARNKNKIAKQSRKRNRK